MGAMGATDPLQRVPPYWRVGRTLVGSTTEADVDLALEALR
jgi:hypothetical protein